MKATIRVTLVTLLLALGGCGDDQVKVNNAYVSATDRMVRAFESEFQQLQTSFTTVSAPGQDRRTLTKLQAAVDRVVAGLTQIKAPAKIAPLHARLIRQVTEYGTVIRTAKQSFASDDLRRVIADRARFSTTLAAVATRITTTINAINERLR